MALRRIYRKSDKLGVRRQNRNCNYIVRLPLMTKPGMAEDIHTCAQSGPRQRIVNPRGCTITAWGSNSSDQETNSCC